MPSAFVYPCGYPRSASSSSGDGILHEPAFQRRLPSSYWKVDSRCPSSFHLRTVPASAVCSPWSLQVDSGSRVPGHVRVQMGCGDGAPFCCTRYPVPVQGDCSGLVPQFLKVRLPLQSSHFSPGLGLGSQVGQNNRDLLQCEDSAASITYGSRVPVRWVINLVSLSEVPMTFSHKQWISAVLASRL